MKVLCIDNTVRTFRTAIREGRILSYCDHCKKIMYRDALKSHHVCEKEVVASGK